MPAGIYPDGIGYAPAVNKLFVSDETGATDTVIDAATNKRIATIPMGGEVGNTQYDPVSRHIFANVQTRDDLVEIDPVTDNVIARSPLPGARGNHGLLIDPASRLAFIACEGNDNLLVLDMRSMKVVADFAVGRAPDVLSFDDSLGLLHVASKSGVVSLFRVKGRAVEKLGQGNLGDNAHAVAVDATTHKAYFPLKAWKGNRCCGLRCLSPRYASPVRIPTFDSILCGEVAGVGAANRTRSRRGRVFTGSSPGQVMPHRAPRAPWRGSDQPSNILRLPPRAVAGGPANHESACRRSDADKMTSFRQKLTWRRRPAPCRFQQLRIDRHDHHAQR